MLCSTTYYSKFIYIVFSFTINSFFIILNIATSCVEVCSSQSFHQEMDRWQRRRKVVAVVMMAEVVIIILYFEMYLLPAVLLRFTENSGK